MVDLALLYSLFEIIKHRKATGGAISFYGGKTVRIYDHWNIYSISGPVDCNSLLLLVVEVADSMLVEVVLEELFITLD